MSIKQLPPTWVRDAVFYQIFPDRFARGAPRGRAIASGACLEKWGQPPTLAGYKGGNLWGVLDRLGYLHELGINAIYLNPIFQSTSNHRYNVHDYLHIDPLLGGMKAFVALLERASQYKIRVIIDGVFNHVGRGFFYFNDIVENGKDSPWVDWFKITDWPIAPYDETRPPNYVCWEGLRALPQLNHANRGVREYIMTVAETWTHAGINGWRLDVPDYIRVHGFWEEFRKRIKKINDEAYLVGELLHESPQWLDGTRFDGLTNYPFYVATVMFVAGDRLVPRHLKSPRWEPLSKINAEEYRQRLERLLSAYPKQFTFSQFNFVENHDQARLITLTGGDRSSLELATFLMMTFVGAPCIYYGSEVGMQGGLDPDCRRAFPSTAEWDIDFLEFHRHLIKLRSECFPLRAGAFRSLYAKGNTFAFARAADDAIVFVVANTDDTAVRFSISPLDSLCDSGNSGSSYLRSLRVLYGVGAASWRVEGDTPHLDVEVPGRSGFIFAPG